MKTISTVWSMTGKLLVASAGVALLWNLYPVLAGILGVIIALCFIAYWSEKTESPGCDAVWGLDDFNRRLAQVEAGAGMAVEVIEIQQEGSIPEKEPGRIVCKGTHYGLVRS